MDRYIDPNSGAAPQPGGFSPVPLVEEDKDVDETPVEEFDNHTTPEQARSEADADADSGAPEPVSEELQAGAPHDAEVEHSGGPSGPQPGVPDAAPAGPVAPYAAPGVATDEEGNPVKADGEPLDDNGADANTEPVDETTLKAEQPSGNAGWAKWKEFAAQSVDQETVDKDAEDLSYDDFKAKYGDAS